MRNLLLGIAALAACAIGTAKAVAEDLEILDPQIAQAFAQVLTEAAEKTEKLQVKVVGDCEKSCGVHQEQHGLILVPNKEISPENEAANSDPGAPLAHLFMSKGYTPVIDGKPVDVSKLRTISFTGQDGNEQKVYYWRWLLVTPRMTTCGTCMPTVPTTSRWSTSTSAKAPAPAPSRWPWKSKTSKTTPARPT